MITTKINLDKIKVLHKVFIELNLIADDWQLYDKPNRDFIAQQLNTNISIIINDLHSNKEARCCEILKVYRDWGANDSEGYETLKWIFKEANLA